MSNVYKYFSLIKFVEIANFTRKSVLFLNKLLIFNISLCHIPRKMDSIKMQPQYEPIQEVPAFKIPRMIRVPKGGIISPDTHFQVDPITKKMLINRIVEIRNKADGEVSLVIERLSAAIKNINNQARDAIEKIESFKNLCENIIREISKIDGILKAPIYGPLETLLLSDNIKDVLLKMTPPKVLLSWPQDLFSFISSTFPHEIYNDSSFSIGFGADTQLAIFPKNTKDPKEPLDLDDIEDAAEKSKQYWSQFQLIDCPAFTNTACYMALDSGRIIQTGGKESNKVYIIDTVNLQLAALPDLKQARELHGMG